MSDPHVGKRVYLTRDDAAAALESHQHRTGDAGLHVYPCPQGEHWHLGHRKKASEAMDAYDLYRQKQAISGRALLAGGALAAGAGLAAWKGLEHLGPILREAAKTYPQGKSQPVIAALRNARAGQLRLGNKAMRARDAALYPRMAAEQVDRVRAQFADLPPETILEHTRDVEGSVYGRAHDGTPVARVNKLRGLGVMAHELGHLREPKSRALRVNRDLAVALHQNPLLRHVGLALGPDAAILSHVPHLVEEGRAWAHGLRAVHDALGTQEMLRHVPAALRGYGSYLGSAVGPAVVSRARRIATPAP